MPEKHGMPGMPARQSNVLRLGDFKGVDMTSGPMEVDPRRSPDAPNMMPGDYGTVQRRPGWVVHKTFAGRINGLYSMMYERIPLNFIHEGTRMWVNDVLVASDMADDFSQGVELAGCMWILDGKAYRCYEAASGRLRRVDEMAAERPPVVSLAKAPNGLLGATSYQPVNMMTGWRTDSFRGTDSDTMYQLSFGGLTSGAVTVEIMDARGFWVVGAIAYTVERAQGRVVFSIPPGAPAWVGRDNVRITYEVNTGQAEIINKCRICVLYGVGGNMDRIFMTGNYTQPARDYYSEWNDPVFIGDANYGQLGKTGNPILGYSLMNDCLVAHKAGESQERNRR